MNSDQVHKPRGLAALKISNPERFAEIVKKGGAASPGFRAMTKEELQELGRKHGRKKNVDQSQE